MKKYRLFFRVLFIVMLCFTGCGDDFDSGCTLCEESDENGWRIREDFCSENQVCRVSTSGIYYCFDLTQEGTAVDATCGDDDEGGCFIDGL